MKGKTAKEVAREIENADPLKVGETRSSHPCARSLTQQTTNCNCPCYVVALALDLGFAPHPSATHAHDTFAHQIILTPHPTGRGQAGRVNSLPNRRGGLCDRAAAHRQALGR